MLPCLPLLVLWLVLRWLLLTQFRRERLHKDGSSGDVVVVDHQTAKLLISGGVEILSPPTKLTLTKGQGHYPPFPGLFVCLLKGPASCRLCLLSHPEVRSSIGYGGQCMIKQWFSCCIWKGGLQGAAPQALLRSVTSLAGVVIRSSQGQAQKQRDTATGYVERLTVELLPPVFPGGSQPQVQNRFSVFSECLDRFGQRPTSRKRAESETGAKQQSKQATRRNRQKCFPSIQQQTPPFETPRGMQESKAHVAWFSAARRRSRGA